MAPGSLWTTFFKTWMSDWTTLCFLPSQRMILSMTLAFWWFGMLAVNAQNHSFLFLTVWSVAKSCVNVSKHLYTPACLVDKVWIPLRVRIRVHSWLLWAVCSVLILLSMFLSSLNIWMQESKPLQRACSQWNGVLKQQSSIIATTGLLIWKSATNLEFLTFVWSVCKQRAMMWKPVLVWFLCGKYHANPQSPLKIACSHFRTHSNGCYLICDADGWIRLSMPNNKARMLSRQRMRLWRERKMLRVALLTQNSKQKMQCKQRMLLWKKPETTCWSATTSQRRCELRCWRRTANKRCSASKGCCFGKSSSCWETTCWSATTSQRCWESRCWRRAANKRCSASKGCCFGKSRSCWETTCWSATTSQRCWEKCCWKGRRKENVGKEQQGCRRTSRGSAGGGSQCQGTSHCCVRSDGQLFARGGSRSDRPPPVLSKNGKQISGRGCCIFRNTCARSCRAEHSKRCPEDRAALRGHLDKLLWGSSHIVWRQQVFRVPYSCWKLIWRIPLYQVRSHTLLCVLWKEHCRKSRPLPQVQDRWAAGFWSYAAGFWSKAAGFWSYAASCPRWRTVFTWNMRNVLRGWQTSCWAGSSQQGLTVAPVIDVNVVAHTGESKTGAKRVLQKYHFCSCFFF